MKSRHDAVVSCDAEPAERKESSFPSDSDSSEKENRHGRSDVPSNGALLDSSDEDLDKSKSLNREILRSSGHVSVNQSINQSSNACCSVLATKIPPKPAPRQISSAKKAR